MEILDISCSSDSEVTLHYLDFALNCLDFVLDCLGFASDYLGLDLGPSSQEACF